MRELIDYVYIVVILVKTACALPLVGIFKSSFRSLKLIKIKIKQKHV